MSFYVPGLDAFDGPSETELNIAKNEIVRWWATMTPYEKVGLRKLVEQLGSQIEIQEKEKELMLLKETNIDKHPFDLDKLIGGDENE